MNIKYLKKNLFFQSGHRGCKELDIILGNFAKKFLMDFDSNSTLLYKELLNMPDNDIYNWITEYATPPKQFNHKLLKQIILFNKKKYEKSS